MNAAASAVRGIELREVDVASRGPPATAAASLRTSPRPSPGAPPYPG